MVLYVVEEETGMILPILFECLICIQVFIYEVIHVQKSGNISIERGIMCFCSVNLTTQSKESDFILIMQNI